jgi:hypothetical protein
MTTEAEYIQRLEAHLQTDPVKARPARPKKMKKWQVTLKRTILEESCDIEIEASSRKEAIRKAIRRYDDGVWREEDAIPDTYIYDISEVTA